MAEIRIDRRRCRAGGLVDQVVDAVNPINDKNVFYQGASEVARELTGDEDGTLGTILYDVLHPEEGQ